MLAPEPDKTTCEHQLEELLGDPGVMRNIHLVASEVMQFWSFPCKVARGFVLSAIGEPKTLASIHDAWRQTSSTGEPVRLVQLIIRRRVIDLLRKDARRTDHCSLPATAGAVEAADSAGMDSALGSFEDALERDPRAHLELRQVIQMVQAAVACFARQGQAQQRQAQLLRRYALDEVRYSELSAELACSENALRVRVHKAMLALGKHIRACHADLEDLLDRDRRRWSPVM